MASEEGHQLSAAMGGAGLSDLGRVGQAGHTALARSQASQVSFTRRAATGSVSPQAIHEARLEVNEKGVIKAAAEDVHAKRAHHAPHADATVVKFNRPFLLFVEDELNQRQLFVGQVFNPLQ